MWKGEPLEERVFYKPQPITVGPSKIDTFTVPASRLGDQFPLFAPAADSASYVLTLAEGMSGKLSLGNEPHAVSEFIRRGRGVPSGPFRQQPLATADWGIVGLDDTGDVAFFFQFIGSSVKIGPDRTWIDRFLGQALVFSAVVHIALLVVAFLAIGPDRRARRGPSPDDADRQAPARQARGAQA